MAKFIYCVLCISFIQASFGDEGFPPKPPNSFTAEVQYSFQGKFFVKSETVQGLSVFAIENVDNVKNRSEISWQIEYDIEGVKTMRSKRFVWNPDLAIVKNYLIIESLGVPYTPDRHKSCTADAKLTTSIDEILLGFSNESPQRPSLNGLLYFGKEQFVQDGTGEINGIPVKKYKKHLKEAFGGKYNIDAEVIVYWSDPKAWHGSAGKDRSVPVFATILGKINNEPANIYMTYIDYYEVAHDRAFDAIPDLWCKDMIGERVPVPITDDRFTYEGEFILYMMSNGTKRKIILPSVEYYDFTERVSVHEYKLLDFLSVNPIDERSPYVRDVLDFDSELAYKTNLYLGNCSVDDISYIDTLGDIEIDQHGHFQMMSPGEFWGADKKQSVITGHKERGLDISSYLYIKEDDDYVASTYFDVTTKNSPVPIRLLVYPRSMYNSKINRRELNIFGYQSNPNFEFPYDITHCFPDNRITHRILATSWTPEMHVYNDQRFINEIVRRKLAMKAQISFIRMQNIEVLRIDQKNKAIHFVFSMLDVHPSLNTSKSLPPGATLPLSSAVENLSTALKDGKVKFLFMGKDGKYIESTPIYESFKETVRNKPPVPNYGVRYSSGSMAALGIFMTIFGIIGGAVGYHFYTQRR